MKKETCLNKKYIVGIDIGNSTTEIALAKMDDETGTVTEFESGLHETTGLKGTPDNLAGIETALENVLKAKNIDRSQIAQIRINEAAPVIGDFAMETITKTVITESTMIGHNPDTPGGEGVSVGLTIRLEELSDIAEQYREKPESSERLAYIVIIRETTGFTEAAQLINQYMEAGIDIAGAILKNDDGVLISNRLKRKIPIVDEVRNIEKIALKMTGVIEVAPVGKGIKMLSNPYGIATLLHLNPSETRAVTPIAKALAGLRSAVVIKTPKEEIDEKTIPLGQLILTGSRGKKCAEVSRGASEIMEALEKAGEEIDVDGEKGTVVGGIISGIKQRIAETAEKDMSDIRISDILAIDTIVPQKITGGFEGEYANENAIAIAAMVKTESAHMKKLAGYFSQRLQIPIEVVGIEANMAALGTLTTPGADSPLAIVDIGAGSTDACYYSREGKSRFIHLAGAGNMVSMVINSEMRLNDMAAAEAIKKYPLAKVDSFYSIHHEDGSIQFFDSPLPKELYGKVILVAEGEFIPVVTSLNMERIRQIRRNAKQVILVQNIIRGLKRISPTGSLTAFEHVLMVGGSALDFELGNMVTEKLERYGITAGQANIMGREGPRGAVATGLLLSIGGWENE